MDLDVLKKFYKNKKVFITGHTGFKGIWLYLILNFLGAKVYGFSLKIQKNDDYKFYKLIKKKIRGTYGDILDYNSLKKSIFNFKPDIIFHLAAQSLVIESQKNPKLTFETNVVGTNNLINISRKIKKVKSIVIATSDKCYLNKNKFEYFKENSRIGGCEPYSLSKSFAEILIGIYINNNIFKSYKGISSVRAGNVIGGGDFAKSRILPDIIKNYKNKKIILRNPNSIRPWQHIFDVATAYLFIPVFHYRNSKKYSGPYNVGPNNKSFLNVKNLTKLFTKFLNVKYEIYYKKGKFIESKYVFLNSSKIKKQLHWKPLYSINESLKITSNWYNCFLKNKKNIFNLSNEQIKNFFHPQ